MDLELLQLQLVALQAQLALNVKNAQVQHARAVAQIAELEKKIAEIIAQPAV